LTTSIPDQGDYRSLGGTVDAACIQAEFSFFVGPYGYHVEVGAYKTYNHTGQIYRVANPNQGATGGWTYYDRDTGYASGNNGGWTDALNYYLATGGCSVNWDIWIDQKVVCRDGEHVDQS
jgi:hypothetical protein